MKQAYKDKCFSESGIFRWHGDFKKRYLSTALAYKPGQPESVMNEWNVQATLQETSPLTIEEIVALTYILKASIFCILHINLQLCHACSRWVLSSPY